MQESLSEPAPSLTVGEESLSAGPTLAATALPRPGLGMAVLIVLGIPLVQFVAMQLYLAVAVPELASETNVLRLFKQLSPTQLTEYLALGQGLFVLTAFLAARWAFGRRFPQILPSPLPAMRHIALIFLLVLPLAVLDLFLAQQAIDVSENLFGQTPFQGELPQLLSGVSREASVGLLLMLLAVMPALGEELVFRGVIGRGLIARKGLVFGVLWTSILFSVVHGNPVQSVGVFFVGVMCHVSYLATRSLLAPILLHFLNNTLPVFAMKILAVSPSETSQAADPMAGGVNPFVALAAAICVAAIAALLWKSRVEYLDEEGRVIGEGVPSVEMPANAAFRRCRPVAEAWVVSALGAYLAFLAGSSLAMPV